MVKPRSFSEHRSFEVSLHAPDRRIQTSVGNVLSELSLAFVGGRFHRLRIRHLLLHHLSAQ